LFRIDRRFVKLTGTKFHLRSNEEDSEVGAEGEFPDAATSAEAIINDYLSVAELEVKARAREILDEAKEEANQIKKQAQEEAQAERKRGYDEGYAKGEQEGRHSFDEELAEKIREDDERLKIVLDEIDKERERTLRDMEEDITNLSLEIVKKIINPAEDELGSVFTSLIKNALRQVPTDGKITIRVGSAEYERFFSSGAAVIELDSGATVTADVIRDVSLTDGDCIMDTEDIAINAGLDSQLKYVRLAFERANQYEPD
jgi:flagellar assembly protein FliH